MLALLPHLGFFSASEPNPSPWSLRALPRLAAQVPLQSLRDCFGGFGRLSSLVAPPDVGSSKLTGWDSGIGLERAPSPYELPEGILFLTVFPCSRAHLIGWCEPYALPLETAANCPGEDPRKFFEKR